MTNRVEKAIDIFLDAINKGTLAKGTCTACAVGNLVAYGSGAEINKNRYGNLGCEVPNSDWSNLFVTPAAGQEQRINKEYLDDHWVLANIEATDFNWQELARIENAFENAAVIYYSSYKKYSPTEVRDDQIKGLEAVVKVMLEFDECEDDVKEVFTAKAELIGV